MILKIRWLSLKGSVKKVPYKEGGCVTQWVKVLFQMQRAGLAFVNKGSNICVSATLMGAPGSWTQPVLALAVVAFGKEPAVWKISLFF